MLASTPGEVGYCSRIEKSLLLEPLVQTQWVYPSAEYSKFFILNEIWSLREVLNGNCSRFCDGQILRVQQLSTLKDFLPSHLKEFDEESRVEHLVPNQIPRLIEPY